MNPSRRSVLIVVALVAWCGAARAGKPKVEFWGRIAPQFLFAVYPDNSLFRPLIGSTGEDLNLDARTGMRVDHERWNFEIDHQFIALWGDTIEATRQIPGSQLFARLPTDERRLFDLTHVFTDEGNFAALQRLDRLAVKHTTDKTVVRFGRQAITWGNGLIYNVIDIFNPFDPAAVDKEFKTGDDMLYGQYLRGGGDDVQGVMVFRRSLITGDVEAEDSSLAFKYHGLTGRGEYDVLAAQHFDDPLVAAGGNLSVGGAVWRGDLMLTFADDETVVSAVTNLTYSWIWNKKNVSGVLEYFHNGFGQSGGCYAPECLASNPELVRRIARGELFTLGTHYLAASAMVEVTPLFLVTPNLFLNVGDPSGLVQFVMQNDLREDLLLFTAVNVPFGADGTEFGGIPSTIPGLFLSNDLSLFAQLRWYW